MKTTREKNPMKELAKRLAHQWDYESRIDSLNEWEREETREEGVRIRNEISEKGYDVNMIVHYAHEYKTLTLHQYMEWIFLYE